MGDPLLSIAGTGKNCGLSMRLSSPGPVLDENHAPMGPEILSSTEAGAWRKAAEAFADCSSLQFMSQGSYSEEFLNHLAWAMLSKSLQENPFGRIRNARF